MCPISGLKLAATPKSSNFRFGRFFVTARRVKLSIFLDSLVRINWFAKNPFFGVLASNWQSPGLEKKIRVC